MQNKNKLFLFSIFLVLLSALVFAAAKDSIADAIDAFQKGDLAASNQFATQLVFDIISELNLVRWAAILIGFLVVIFIVMKLSDFLNKPRVDKKQLKKEKEDSKFREMFKAKQKPLEGLKNELWDEKKK